MVPVSAFRLASLSSAALAMAACLDLGGPAVDVPIEVKLDFCANDVPIWFAHQNGIEPWKAINPDAAGTYTFPAGSRAGVAFVRQNGSDYRTDVIFTTNRNLELVSAVSCVEEGGAKQISGSVAGLSGSQQAIVAMSSSSVSFTAPQTSFTLTNLVDRPLDLVASRMDVGLTEQQANKTIIRRNQNPASGTTVAPLDFDAEGVAPASVFATFTGLLQDDVPSVRVDLITALGTSHLLASVDAAPAASSVPFAVVPASALTAGDLHRLAGLAVTPDGGERGVERYFTDAAEQGLAFGPALQFPLVVRVDSLAPYLRLATTLPGQIEYSTSVRTHFRQLGQGLGLDFVMTYTASYFGGTPFIWNLLIPDLSDAPGWDNSWGLKAGGIDWTVTAVFGRPALLFGDKPVPGETVVFASRTSVVTIGDMELTRAASPRIRAGVRSPGSR